MNILQYSLFSTLLCFSFSSMASMYFGVLLPGQSTGEDCPSFNALFIDAIVVDNPITEVSLNTQPSVDVNCAGIVLSMVPFIHSKLQFVTGDDVLKFDGILAKALFNDVNPIFQGAERYPLTGTIVDIGSCLLNEIVSTEEGIPNNMVVAPQEGTYRLCLKKADFN